MMLLNRCAMPAARTIHFRSPAMRPDVRYRSCGGIKAARLLLLYCRKPAFGVADVGKGRKGFVQHLDDSHDHVCLNFGGNLAAAMFVGNCGCGVVGGGFQLSGVSGLDFVAQRGSLTIGNGRNAR